MVKQSGTAMRRDDESVPTRAVDSMFWFVRFAEFEILFILFFVIAFIIFKDLVSPLFQFFFYIKLVRTTESVD
ncbi:hypothetical protein Hanom_Chr15g01354991 [Helianthus anomalus]